MSENKMSMELSAEELEVVSGGARSQKAAFTRELIDENASLSAVGRNGIASDVVQNTDDFAAELLERNETGK